MGTERTEADTGGEQGKGQSLGQTTPPAADVLSLACVEQNCLVNGLGGGPADGMDQLGIRADDRPAAGTMAAQAEVGVLAIHKKPFIETTKLLPEIVFGEEETTGNDTDLTDTVSLPRSQ